MEILNQKCKSCGKCQHDAYECPISHVISNRDKLIYNSNRSFFQERDPKFLRVRMKNLSILKYIMVEMSPDYNPMMYEQQTTKKGVTQTNINFVGVTDNYNQIGTFYQIAHPHIESNQLISQKNYASSNMALQPDVTSMLQPYSITEINNWTPSNSKMQQSYKGMEIMQKFKQRLNSLKTRTFGGGSQGLIPPPLQQQESNQTSHATRQKQTYHDLDIQDSSLYNSERQYQKPTQNESLLPFNKYFCEEDQTQNAYSSIPSIDQASPSIPINYINPYPSSSIVYSQPLRSQSKHYSLQQKMQQSQQNQMICEETKVMNPCDMLSPHVSNSNSNIFYPKHVTEDSKNTDPTTIGKIHSDLSVSIRPETLKQSSLSKKGYTNQSGMKQGSQRTIYTGGIIKPVECKGESAFRKEKVLPVTSHHIPSQTHLDFLEEKCCELDIRKDYQIYFASQNCDLILKKYNDRNLKASIKSSGKRVAMRNNKRGILSNPQQRKLSFLPKLKNN